MGVAEICHQPQASDADSEYTARFQEKQLEERRSLSNTIFEQRIRRQYEVSSARESASEIRHDAR